jgi:hypothetical protein
MNRIAVNRIANFAACYNHAWGSESNFEDFLPTGICDTPLAEQEAIIIALEAMEAACKAAQNPQLPTGIGVWDSFVKDAHGHIASYFHRTITKRLTVQVNENDNATVTIWRPTPEGASYSVLCVTGNIGVPNCPQWQTPEVLGPAFFRHWFSLAKALAAFNGSNEWEVFQQIAPVLLTY